MRLNCLGLGLSDDVVFSGLGLCGWVVFSGLLLGCIWVGFLGCFVLL